MELPNRKRSNTHNNITPHMLIYHPLTPPNHFPSHTTLRLHWGGGAIPIVRVSFRLHCRKANAKPTENLYSTTSCHSNTKSRIAHQIVSTWTRHACKDNSPAPSVGKTLAHMHLPSQCVCMHKIRMCCNYYTLLGAILDRRSVAQCALLASWDVSCAQASDNREWW